MTTSKGLLWFYFGCRTGAGHYLCESPHNTLPKKSFEYLERFDGRLAPIPEPGVCNYKAALTRFGNIGFSALSWWDRSVDTRRGSNSIIFVSSLDISADGILTLAPQHFPWVFRRLPKPVTIMDVSRVI